MSYQLSSDVCKAESLTFCSPFERRTDAIKDCRQQHQRDTQIAVFWKMRATIKRNVSKTSRQRFPVSPAEYFRFFLSSLFPQKTLKPSESVWRILRLQSSYWWLRRLSSSLSSADSAPLRSYLARSMVNSTFIIAPPDTLYFYTVYLWEKMINVLRAQIVNYVSGG